MGGQPGTLGPMRGNGQAAWIPFPRLFSTWSHRDWQPRTPGARMRKAQQTSAHCSKGAGKGQPHGTRNYQAKPHLHRHPPGQSEEPRCPPRHAAIRHPRCSHCGAEAAPQCQRNHHGVNGVALHQKSRGPSPPAHGEVSEAPAREGMLVSPSLGCAWGRGRAGMRPWGAPRPGRQRGLPEPGDSPTASGREDSHPSCSSDEAGSPVPSPPHIVSEKASWNRRFRKLPNPVIHTQNVQISMETSPVCHTEKTRIPNLNLKSQ